MYVYIAGAGGGATALSSTAWAEDASSEMGEWPGA